MLKWAAFLVIVLVIISPWIVPENVMRHAVSLYIGGASNSIVTVSDARFNWFDGLTIKRLKLTDNQTCNSIRVGRIHIPFEPVSFLRTGEVSFLRIEDVKVDIEPKGSGKSPFSFKRSGSSSLPVRRLQFSNLQINVDKTAITFPWLELVNNIRDNRIQWYGQARVKYLKQDAGKIFTKGIFEIDKSGGDQIFTGSMQLDWQDLKLPALHLNRVKELELSELAGSSSGRLALRLFPNFKLQWNLQTAFRELRIARFNYVERKLERLRISTTGTYDPLTGNIDMPKLNVISKDIAARSVLHLKFQESGLLESECSLTGHFDSKLLPLMGDKIANIIGNQNSINGPCTVNLHWKAGTTNYTIDADVSADDVVFKSGKVTTKHKGDKCRFEIALRSDAKNWPWMTLEKCTVNFDDITARVSATLPRIDPDNDLAEWLDQTRRLGQFEVNISTKKIESLGKKISQVNSALSKINLTGPVNLKLSYAGQENIARAELALALGKNATLRVQKNGMDGVFVKPAGKKLTFNFRGYWPWKAEYSRVSFSFDAECNGLKIENDGGSGKLLWSIWEDEQGKTFVELVNKTGVKIQNIKQAMTLSPWLVKLKLAKKFGGDVDFSFANAVQFSLDKRGWHPQQIRLHSEVNAQNSWLKFPDIFNKSQNDVLKFSADYKYERNKRYHKLIASVVTNGVNGRFAISGQQDNRLQREGRFTLNITDFRRAIASIPRLREELGDKIALSGNARGVFHWQRNGKGDFLKWNINAEKTRIVVDKKEAKPMGVPAGFEGQILLATHDADKLQTYNVKSMQVKLGKSFVHLKKGILKIHNVPAARWIKQIGVEPWIALRKSPVKFLDLALSGRLDTKLIEVLKPYQASGYCDFGLKSKLQNNHLQTRIIANLDNLSLQAGKYFDKSDGTKGNMELEFSSWPDVNNPKTWLYQIEQMAINMGPARISGRGYGKSEFETSRRIKLSESETQFVLAPVDVSQLADISPLLKKLKAKGRISSMITVNQSKGKFTAGASYINLENLRAQARGKITALDGRINFSNDFVNCDKLMMKVGESEADLAMQLVVNEGKPVGIAEVKSDFLDMDSTRVIMGNLFSEILPPPANKGQKAKPLPIKPILRILGRSNVLLDFNAKRLNMTDPRNNVYQEVHDLVCTIKVGENGRLGQLYASFWGKLSDGIAKGTISADLTKKNPTVAITSDLDNLKMVPKLRPLVEDFFPGLIVTGRISIDESSKVKMFTTPGTAPNYPAGKGEMVFVDGYMEGQAAPDWVVKIFPGLSFTKYSFNRMHNWFTKTSDGVTHNNMIYRGKLWNIYIEGESFPDGKIKYEVGVDILARYESEYWSSVGQGRVPIFVTTAIVQKRKMKDQKITYVPPQTVIYRVLIKNNVLTGAYRALKRQFTKQSTAKQ